jgi:SAM-dependent methyltransferase
MTIRRPVKRALEIGTGCGALALKASRHAKKVIATDTNPRALNFATFNAAINGITNVEWRLGSLFEPVKGELFDLVFCNPPYVISPDTKLIFRDGGRRGDSLCEEIIRTTPGYLEEGGYATFLINWGIHKDEEWSAPIRRWTENNRCDTWIVLSGSQDPVTYAAVWNRTRDSELYAENLERWITYFDELKLAGVGLGIVVLRRRTSATPWVRADQLPDSITAPSGTYIERLFEAQDRLTAWSGDEPVLAARYHAAPRTQLRQLLTIKDAQFGIDAAEILLSEGLPFKGNVDVFASQLLARCDGTRALRDIASDIAGQAGADEATFTATAAGIARRLIAMGFLVVAHETPAVDHPSTDRLEGSVR